MEVIEEIKTEAMALEKDVETLIENVASKPSSLLVPILITLLLIIIGGYLMQKHSLIASNTRSFIICGQQGSGKTNLFHLLTKRKLPILTVSTLECKVDDLLMNEEFQDHKTFQDVKIIDFPANKKLKNLYLTPYLHEHLNEIQGIIYIIDSSNFDSNACHKVAEDLLEILNITESKLNGIDVLIFANKNDLFTSKKSEKIKELLESEIGKIHDLKLRGLNKVDIDSNKNDLDNEDNLDLAIKNGKFQFQLLEGNIDFSQGNIFKDKWSTITDWIYEKIAN